MKRIATLLIAVALLAALGVTALAEGWTEYVTKDNVKVYADYDTSSKVIARMDKGDKVTVLDIVDMQGKWRYVSVKVKGKNKKGFMLSKYLTSEKPCNHKWGKWYIVDKPTCTQKGYRERQCTKCGILDSETMPKADHTYGKWKITREPTCTRTGERTRTCTYCGHKQTQSVEKAPHEYGKWTVTKEPTCTAKGSRYRKCKVCGAKQEQVMDKVPHDYRSWVIEKEATCSSKGLRSRTCRVCGYEETQDIAKLPHDFKWNVIEKTTDHSSGTRQQVCQVCGHTEAPVSYDPKGTLRRGARSDEVRTVQQLLADQGYLAQKGVDGIFGGGMERAITQFQKDQGLNPDGVCWPQTIKRLNHEFGPWTVVTPVTRSADGERVRTCKDCGYEQRETIQAGTVMLRKRRGEDVRTVQQMLTDLGYNPGTCDGIYGGKLDTAFAAFATDHDMEFAPGKVLPSDVDALTNAWMAAQSAESWKGAGDSTTPVNLVLTVTPAADNEAEGDLRTFDWRLTNLGSEKCTFRALLLSYGDTPDFMANTLTLVVDSVELKANGVNSASGSFTVASDWGEGRLNFSALAVAGKTGGNWTSNVVTD